MNSLQIKGVNGKVTLFENYILIKKLLKRDININVNNIISIEFTVGNMAQNSKIIISWTLEKEKITSDTIMFWYNQNDIAREIINYLLSQNNMIEYSEQTYGEAIKENIKQQINNRPNDTNNLNKIPTKRQLEKQRIKELKEEHIPYCPKCHSTSLQYVEQRKKLSLGRAAVGGALIGPAGAVLGGLTSNKYKGKVKCLNCGHEWKL